MKDNTWSCANRMQKIQMTSPSTHFGPATAQNSSSLWPNLSLANTSLESKYLLSSASVSLETISVVCPVGFVRKKLNCNPLIFGFVKETVYHSELQPSWMRDFPLKISGSEVSSKIMAEPPRSFRRGNSDHEKQKTDTGVLHNIIIAVIQLIYLTREITLSSMKRIVFEIEFVNIFSRQ